MGQCVTMVTHVHVRFEMQRIRGQVADCEETLRRLQSGGGQDPLRVFGGYMSDIVRRIHSNRGRFRKLPKGPIGGARGCGLYTCTVAKKFYMYIVC